MPPTPRSSVSNGNPWFRQYGVIGALFIVVIGLQISNASGIATMKTRLAVAENTLRRLAAQKIPPDVQIAHNNKNDQEIRDLHQEIMAIEAHIDAVEAAVERRLDEAMTRFHALLPRILLVLERLAVRSSDERFREIPPDFP